VVALPCVVDPEGDRDGLPTVLLEAMALGTPVISTRVAGIPEMIDDGHTGLLVDERDAPALADAIAAVLDSPALQARLRAGALERVQRDFSLTGNVRRLRASFETAGQRLTA
jgi:glycosyltransferase involved in cell wall biosynthesis